jgi:hypothetical protein
MTPVRVQTFCSGWKNNEYLFEVDETLHVDTTKDTPYVTRTATWEELATTIRKRFTVAEAVMPGGETLKDTQPAIYWTGWAAHVHNHNSEFLRMLVEYPEPRNSKTQADLLYEFAEEVQQVFFSEQRELNQRSGILRKILSNTGKK